MIDMQKLDANTIDTRALPPIYVVHAMRWGSSENHSYIVLATIREIDAMAAAEMTEIHRGGKYGCEITCFNCGEKTVIRAPYNDKSVCFNCEFHGQRTGLICQQCIKFNNWSAKS